MSLQESARSKEVQDEGATLLSTTRMAVLSSPPPFSLASVRLHELHTPRESSATGSDFIHKLSLPTVLFPGS